MTVASAPTIEELLALGVPARDLARWSEWTLTRVGFRPSNVLMVLSVCRDELMLPVEDAVHEVWGPSFDASSLAGLPLLGRTGMAAALGHTPGEDGRHRFLVVTLTHVGLDEHGEVGLVARRGIRRSTSACGALVAARTRLLTGDTGQVLDPDDVEMSLLMRALAEDVGAGAVPDLLALTDLTRTRATAELERLVDGLQDAGAPVDHATISGIVVHGPDGDDVVVVREAFLEIDRVRTALPVG